MPESDLLDVESMYFIDSKITKFEYLSYALFTSSFVANNQSSGLDLLKNLKIRV